MVECKRSFWTMWSSQRMFSAPGAPAGFAMRAETVNRSERNAGFSAPREGVGCEER
jgi:hypothetical protein